MAGRIVFDHVWKRFHRGPAHDSLRDLIPALARRAVGRGRQREELEEGDFWAVRDVDFEVLPGQALGIIGGNGAGKSTTLKLLTKILGPTRGTARVEGRVGSLIEVSAGFHPDLSGRENVFLQGAIMGMPQKLIRERFDDIVDFSGISAFIDTPVKRYSSGMNARLGFSIAVHLEPDVLIIDEVLSVGDAQFQQLAFERITALVRGNIPVVIVSHQLDRIVELCSECILLKQGQVAFRGDPARAVQEHLHGGSNVATATDVEAESIGVVLHELRVSSEGPVVSGARLPIVLRGAVTHPAPPPHLEVELVLVDAAANQRVWFENLHNLKAHPDRSGAFEVTFDLQVNVPAGLYRLETVLWHDQRQLVLGQGPSRMFQVVPGAPFSGTHQLNATARLG
ncbi:MAG: ABC transporter ATP-binding protein [Gemmatimonadetes bacterium]|nr:ABC transporter ATP-binding protein [Gemmatimonadota bacterium]MBL0179936.1 ABC transporter ATP-binding protein [Gemmatimonadota bacterium]